MSEGSDNLGDYASAYVIEVLLYVYFCIKYQIMIKLIILIKQFLVCIKIKTILTFPNWNNFYLLFRTPLFYVI